MDRKNIAVVVGLFVIELILADSLSTSPLYLETLTPEEYQATLIIIIFFIAYVSCAVIGAIWVYKDANSHGDDGLIWAILIFSMSVIGIIIYLIIRRYFEEPLFKDVRQMPKFVDDYLHSSNDKEPVYCEKCSVKSSPGSKFCHGCGTKL